MSAKTLNNCSLIKKVSIYEGIPKQYDKKCEGYCNEDRDEPMEICKQCKLNTTYEGE